MPFAGLSAIVHYHAHDVLNKLLAFAFVGLIVGKMFFRPQLKALGKWLDGVVNAFLIAIVIAYSLQLLIYLTSR